jgi:hypothetical protein
MPKLLTCPQGHQWEIDDRDNALTTDVRVLCPTCGAAVDLASPDLAKGPDTGTDEYAANLLAEGGQRNSVEQPDAGIAASPPPTLPPV